MKRPKEHPVPENLSKDFDWDNVDWDDLDAGEYTNLCPDGNRKLFEYGARCIAESAEKGDVYKMLVQLPPSKIIRELTQLDNDLRKLSFTTRNILYDINDKPFNSPLDQLQRRVKFALESVPIGRSKHDEARVALGRDAWAIWAAHDGDVKDDDFLTFVERLVNNAGRGDEPAYPEESEDAKKIKISADALAHEIRKDAETQGPPGWQLFSSRHFPNILQNYNDHT